MAPYKPPSAHYAHVRVDLYDDDVVLKFMGSRGWRFYDLTSQLKMYYIWWNKKLRIIEIWGPYLSFKNNNPVEVIHGALDKFVTTEYFNKNVSE
jgi:hypothetical protein